MHALSKIIIEEDVNLIVAAAIDEKRCRDEVHISCGVRSKVSGKASLHPLVFPGGKKQINFYTFYGRSSIMRNISGLDHEKREEDLMLTSVGPHRLRAPQRSVSNEIWKL